MNAVRPDRCETCAWWTRAPALATATRRPDGADQDLGACHLNAPWTIAPGVSTFPEVHAHRFCSDWMTACEPDGGGGEERPVGELIHLRDGETVHEGKVVQLRDAA